MILIVIDELSSNARLPSQAKFIWQRNHELYKPSNLKIGAFNDLRKSDQGFEGLCVYFIFEPSTRGMKTLVTICKICAQSELL